MLAYLFGCASAAAVLIAFPSIAESIHARIADVVASIRARD